MFLNPRRTRLVLASWLVVSALALSAAWTSPAVAAGKTITAVMHSDLRVIDPIF
ncbi:MAG: peptide/nickel transport system substrate-binding protein, partial [Bradyrhizobium sp.]